MDLRPINPYYRQQLTAAPMVMGLTMADPAANEYSYPYSWIIPVTDRTQADVDHAKELTAIGWRGMTAEQKEEYLSGLKGCMNRADLKRIENDIQILLDAMEISSTSYAGDLPELPTENYFEQMRDNVMSIRNSRYGIHSNTPPVPELPYNTFEKINDIEKILADLYEIVSAQFYYYAGGEIYAGDGTGLLL